MAVVNAPLILARTEEGSVVYLYQGDVVPGSVGKDELDRLADYLDTEESTEDKPKRGRPAKSE